MATIRLMKCIWFIFQTAITWITPAPPNMRTIRCDKSTRTWYRTCTQTHTRAKSPTTSSIRCATKFWAASMQRATSTRWYSRPVQLLRWNWWPSRLTLLIVAASRTCGTRTLRCWACEQLPKPIGFIASNERTFCRIILMAMSRLGLMGRTETHCTCIQLSATLAATSMRWRKSTAFNWPTGGYGEWRTRSDSFAWMRPVLWPPTTWTCADGNRTLCACHFIRCSATRRVWGHWLWANAASRCYGRSSMAAAPCRFLWAIPAAGIGNEMHFMNGKLRFWKKKCTLLREE